MKSFKQYIKPQFEKDSKGRYIIHHSNIGIEKIFHKDKKDRFVPLANKTGIHEIYHELTNKEELNPVIPPKIKKLHDVLHKYYDLHNNPDAANVIDRFSKSSYGTNSTLHDLHTGNIQTKHFPDNNSLHEKVAFHPKTNDDTFSWLINKYKGHKNEYQQKQVLNRIANHKNASSASLMKIAKINPKMYRNTISNNLNGGDDVLDYLNKFD